MIGYSLILPLSPTINHYYKRSRDGRLYISDAGQAFRKEVMAAVERSRMPELKGRVCLVVRVFPRNKRMQDISNRIKALEDALQMAGAFVNDEQIDDLQVTRGAVVPGGRLEIMLGEIDE